jgi:hypothetical protein
VRAVSAEAAVGMKAHRAAAMATAERHGMTMLAVCFPSPRQDTPDARARKCDIARN